MAEMTTLDQPKIEQGIKLTSRALQEVRNIKTKNNIPESYGLRVGVKGGGCSGFSYVLGFEEQTKEGDVVLAFDEINVFVDPKSLSFISGTELDFSDGLNGRGFVFTNPHATRTCGCGSSFSV